MNGPPAAVRLVALPAHAARSSTACAWASSASSREYQHTGVAAKIYVEHFDMAAATPQKWGEMGWILETNTNMNRAMEAMGGRIVRRFRVYERTWDFHLGRPNR